MTPEQIELVQRGFAQVEPIADQAADLFYDRLFDRAPDVRPMFRDDMTDQKRKLMEMLSTAVADLHRIDRILPALEDLGRRHAGYGTRPEHYDSVGEALLWTLEQGLGNAFTPAVAEAWAAAYAAIADVMKTAAAGATKT